MHHASRLSILILTLLISASNSIAAQSETKSYVVSLTIPPHVMEEAKPAAASKEQITSAQHEVRMGQLVKIQSIVVP